jgi:hypothetical protein
MPSKIVHPHGIEVVGYFGPRWNRTHVRIGGLHQVDDKNFELGLDDFLGLQRRLKVSGDEITMKIGNKPIVIKAKLTR